MLRVKLCDTSYDIDDRPNAYIIMACELSLSLYQ